MEQSGELRIFEEIYSFLLMVWPHGVQTKKQKTQSDVGLQFFSIRLLSIVSGLGLINCFLD